MIGTAPDAARPSPPAWPDVGVIVLGVHRWRSIWSGNHFLMTTLSRFFRVVWVDPAHGWRDLVKPSGLLDLALRRRRARDACDGFPNFHVYVPEPWLPNLYRPPRLRRASLHRRIERARRALRQRGCRQIVLYIWHPDFAEALDFQLHDVSIYHIKDEYSYSDVERPITERERNLIRAVDHVFVISPGLLDRKGSINPQTSRIPVGVNYAAYAKPLPEPPDLARIPRPRIGYSGRIKRQLNWDLLERLARLHPEWSFAFVGPKHDHPELLSKILRLEDLPNIHFLGPKPWWEIPAYCQHFDVCIMPYEVTDYTNLIQPLKLFEYLATGLPTIGSRIRALEAFSDVVTLADSPNEWSMAIESALTPAENTDDHVRQRREAARSHDWSRLSAKVADTVVQCLTCRRG